MKLLMILLAVILNPTDFEKAEKLFKQQKLQESKVLFEKHLKTNPNDAKTLEYLGDIAGQLKKWDEALEYYKKIRDQFPNKADYHYKYGGALGMKAKEANKFKALGMIDEVEEAFLKAAKLEPKHVDARWALVMFYIELPAIVGGSEKKSQKFADELMVISKVDGYLAKGYIDEYFKRYRNAETYYVNAHKIGNSSTTFQKLHDLYVKIKEPAKAQKLKDEYQNTKK